jgi:hypothetical protein
MDMPVNGISVPGPFLYLSEHWPHEVTSFVLPYTPYHDILHNLRYKAMKLANHVLKPL